MSWEDTAITSAITFAVEVVKKIFEGKKDDKHLFSVGLAVGYFYNFIAPLYEAIQHEGIITLGDKPEDKDGKKYDAETIEMQLILPKRLDVDTYKRCEEEFNATKKGSIFLQKQKRQYGINYTPVRRGDKSGIIIADLARPLMAVKRFYEDILRYEASDLNNERWRKAQASEIEAFKETLRRLQGRGYGTFPNRLHFHELG
jgi:hypothetical protein